MVKYEPTSFSPPDLDVLNLRSPEDGSYLAKIENLRQEIDFLRQQVSRVSELEEELRQTRISQVDGYGRHSAGSLPANDGKEKDAIQLDPAHGSPVEHQKHVTFEVYDDCRRRFLDCSQELERVKDALKFWQVEAKRWKLIYRNIQPKVPKQTSGGNRQQPQNLPRPSSAPIEHLPLYLDVVKPKNRGNGRSFSGINSSFLPPINNQKTLFGLNEMPEKAHSTADLDQPKQSIFVTSARASEPPFHKHQGSSSTQSPDLSEQQVLQSLGEGTDQSKPWETDSDSPVLVSERKLKRKRAKSPFKASQQPKLVKEEILSSSPIAPHANAAAKGVQESLDLDNVSHPLYTPRKGLRKRRMNDTPSSKSAIADWEGTHQTNNPLFDATNERAEDDNHDLGASNDETYLYTGVENTRDGEYFRRKGEEYAAKLWEHERCSREAKSSKARRHNARKIAKHRTPEAPKKDIYRDRSRDALSGLTYTSVLQPTDANEVLPRTHDRPTNVTKATDFGSWNHGAQVVQSLAEDGEDYQNRENRSTYDQRQNVNAQAWGEHSVSSKIPNPEVQQRLDRLLAGPAPNKPPLSNKDLNANHTRALSNTSKATPIDSKKIQQPIESKTPGSNHATPWTGAKPRNHPPSTMAPITPNPQVNYITPFSKPQPTKSSKTQPSLRSRPLSHLSLNDFKVNPKHNQGYEHPFKETVRRKDRRKCLPGCTRLDCCGKIFRQMAETGLFKPIRTTRFLRGGNSSQDYDDDQTMMEDYLGDRAASRLRKMSEEEKEEVLLQAKTKILADHYGRHREVYAREPSPVGYWDVDMPNSQEAEELGRLAEIRNRQKVEERYREAMRPDGIWKFRDE